MRRPPTPPPPVSVVPPPLPDEVPPIAPAIPVFTRSFIGRVVRDIKIGGVCLLLGWGVGHSGLITQLDRQASTSLADLTVIPQSHADRGDVPTAKVEARSVVDSEVLSEMESSEPSISAVDPAAAVVVVNDPLMIDDLEFAELTDEDSSAESIKARKPAFAEDPGVEEAPAEERYDSDLLFAQQNTGNHEEPTVQAEPSQSLVSQSLASQPLIDKPAVSTSIELPMTLPSNSSIMHPQCEDGTCQQVMESHGTVLKWASTPADAYRMAGQQNKLVFMIHVSGNFEIPGFT